MCQPQVLYLTGIALAHLDSLSLGNLVAIADNLAQQFRVRGERDVLLLYGRVNVCSLLLVALASTTVLPVPLVLLFPLPVLDGKIDADALLEDKLHALLADAVTEVDELRRGAGCGYAESLKAAEVLIVGILCKLSHHLLVGDVAKVLQHKQACHQADWLGRTTAVRTEEGSEGLLEE